MIVTIEELRRVTNQLLDHLEHRSMRDVDLQHDFYWTIPPGERYEPYAEPRTFSLGQLSDDVTELRRIADGNGEPVIYALVWLSAVLHAVGEQTHE